MNANQIIGMVLRMVMRRLLRGGINAGVGAMGKRMGGDAASGPDGRKTVQRSRQALRLGRRFGRF
ncbi:hypothetical protein SAMN05443999_101574 [Roseovarius azorensis]|uniref:Uncharacterized protein n=1 Tax=Roseovarius azorensis TaxID=1287727 RepID=A0A1H7HPN1_9RHOB|nr:hypothetical protein [Roseovarius azorensis]SEK51617.1 hypothetical protein SAMN05443999_101574 [Roseovarius azorensis]